MAGYCLRNVTPIGFESETSLQPTTVRIVDGTIAAMGPATVPEPDDQVVDIQGGLVSPSWIDMHSHVYWGGTDISVMPEKIGLQTGVSTLIDAGSAGEGNFDGFRKFIVDPAAERIVPFINIGSIGLVATNRVPEVRFLADVDLARTMAKIEQHRDCIAGIKVRLCSIIESENDLLPLKLGKKLGRCLGLPLMVHIGRALPLVEEVLERLDSGDIVTHIFHGKTASSIVDDERAFAAAVGAQNRGVLFDIGHGSASFSYRVAREAMRRGIFPQTIGTDAYLENIDGPVWDLSVVMSKLLAMGMAVDKVVESVTIAPRQILGFAIPQWRCGAEADCTVFSVRDSDVALPDSLGDTVRLEKRFIPAGVFWRGDYHLSASRFDKD